MTREAHHAWVLQICREALAVDEIATIDVIRACTGGHEVFCPEAFSRTQLHTIAAHFLMIARL